MKYLVFNIVIILCLCTPEKIQAQINDKELSSLVDIVKMLRVSNATNFNKAKENLSSDLKWTMMDETGAVREGKECKASDNVPRFKLNKILAKVSGSRKYVSTHGDMVNGQSSTYDYSLYERALKARTEVKYNMNGREGKQTFVVIPYDKNAKFEISILCNKKKVSNKPFITDGVIIVEWTKNTPTKSQDFELVVKNTSNTPQSFVLLNHNTRKK